MHMSAAVAAGIGLVIALSLGAFLNVMIARRRITRALATHVAFLIAAAAGVLPCLALRHGRQLLDQSYLLRIPPAAVIATAPILALGLLIAVQGVLLLATRHAARPSLQLRPQQYVKVGAHRPSRLPLILPTGALIEEVEFRGVLQPLFTLLLAPAFGPTPAAWLSVALTALGFGAAHLNRNLIGRVGATIAGIGLGAAVLITHSLLVSTCAHVLGNLIAGVTAWYVDREARTAAG
jgi:CAAX amino terminal protease family.